MGFSTAPYRSRSIVAPTTREVTSRSVSPEVATWAEAIKAARDSSPVRETALGSAATVWLSGEPSEAVSSVWPAACCGPVSAWTACCTGASVASEAMAQESPGINPIPASDNANAETAIFLGNMHFATSAADCGLLIARSFLESRRRHVDQRQSKELYGAERFQIHSCRPVDTSFLGQNRSKFDYRAKSIPYWPTVGAAPPHQSIRRAPSAFVLDKRLPARFVVLVRARRDRRPLYAHAAAPSPRRAMIYRSWTRDHGAASERSGCRACERACPQHLPIVDYLKLVA